MNQAASRKLFTAELQRLRAREERVSGGGGGDTARILAAIELLREEMRALSGSGAAAAAEPAAPPPDREEIDREYERKRAEVNLLRTELQGLLVAIEQTKMEIAALRPIDSKEDRLVVVTNQLDAIVSATEGATNGILEAAEKIDALAANLKAQAGDSFAGHMAADISDAVVGIFEACNFQDITGQRITKVVRTLQFIEERINKMIEIWGADTFGDLPRPADVEIDEEKKLLNGPALEGESISQDDIDKLFG